MVSSTFDVFLFHPSSNGLVERFIQTFKKAMLAGDREGDDLKHRLSQFLLKYRSSPHLTTGVAPCELFLKRSMQTKLDLLRPDVESTVSGHQGCQKSYNDKHAKRREFSVGQAVIMRNLRKGSKWVAGVISERNGPLTLLVEVEPNQYWR